MRGQEVQCPLRFYQGQRGCPTTREQRMVPCVHHTHDAGQLQCAALC